MNHKLQNHLSQGLSLFPLSSKFVGIDNFIDSAEEENSKKYSH